MANGSIYVKDPDATKDYKITWNWVADAGDTITASTWAEDPGNPDTAITIVSSSFTTNTATVTVAGATLGKVYAIVNHITTAGGRQDDQTIYLWIRKM